MPVRTGVAVAVILLATSACGSTKKALAQPPAPNVTSPAPTTLHVAGTPPNTNDTPNLAAVHVALRPVASGLDSPVSLAWRANDARMYVAEQSGRVRIVDTNGTVAPMPVLTLSSLSHSNEEGLLGITFSPDGKTLYTDSTDPGNNTHVDAFTMKGDVADVSTRRQILFVNQPANNHKGGEVTIGPDGLLYIGLGDGGFEGDPARNGQKLSTLLAKILRIDPNPSGSAPYTIPADNPFVGRAGVRPETWMWGLRNPWRFSFDRATGDLWIGDVGQDNYEEIDEAPAGQKGINWGWSVREGLHAYNPGSAPGARDPLFELPHSDGYCAVVGGYVYRGRAIPALDGVYVFGDDCNSQIGAAVQKNGALVARGNLGVTVDQTTTFGEDPSGELYVVSRTGTVYKFVPSS
jgi:glucose/arabinose dehydrogenase